MLSVLVAIFWAVNAQPKDDKVTDLPGLNFDINYEQYSGYLDLSNGHHLHYWITLSEGKSYPNDDPVVVWLNGTRNTAI